MGYLKIVSYLYLVIAAFMIYDGIMRINENEPPYVSFLLAGMAIFMFFFRRRYSDKFRSRQNNK